MRHQGRVKLLPDLIVNERFMFIWMFVICNDKLFVNNKLKYLQKQTKHQDIMIRHWIAVLLVVQVTKSDDYGETMNAFP